MAAAAPRPVTGTWKSRVPRGRAGHAAAVYGDTCYVFGGHMGENKCTDELLSYDFRKKEWFSFNPDPGGPCERDGHTACIAGDTLYVFGGEKSGSEEELLNDLYCLNLQTMTWSIVPPTDDNPAPSPRRGHSACVLGGAIYIFGGHNSHGERRNDLFRFDLVTLTWNEERPATTEPFGLPNRPTKHHIELLPGAVPPKGRIYRMSPAELEELRKQLETLTSKGWIRPNTSEFGAPVLFVPKGNGEFRMCIDYRGLNKITRKSTGPLPRIDDLLDMVQGCTVFSRVDLKSGYHQIEMAEEDVYKTTFKTRYGTYEFLVMPFRLCNAPGTFQTEMHRIFSPYLDKFMVVYLDDILVFSKTAREHAEHLALVLQSLRDSQYKINREKSSFGVPSVIYLGHVISGDGLAPEAAKIVAIQEWPQPQTMRDVRSFMVLQQDGGNGLWPVEFTSKKIKTQKLQDSTYEKELYALVCALKHWKHFLLGRHFKIFSDHSTLQWMKSQGELNDKLARYIQFIDMFDFELKHKKGCYNKVADALSRRRDSFALISFTHSFGEETRQIIAHLLPQDETFRPIVRNLQADPNSEPDYALSSDLLYTYSRGEERLCIPQYQRLRTLLMSECHDARGHFGFLKSYAALSQRFFWKEMRSNMLRYVDTCELCQRNKVHRRPPLGLLKPLPIPDGPAESVAIDFTDLGKTTLHGMRQVMVCVDRFSKHAEFIPLPEVARVPAVRAAFSERRVTHHGPPTSIVSDRDPRFCCDEWQSYCKDYLHSRLDMTSGHHPEANGQAEVMNQVLFQLLRPVISLDQQDWDLHLARAQLMYNMSVHSSTGFSPYRLHWRREPRQPLDEIIDKAKPDLTPGTIEFTRRYRLDVERARANLFKAQKAMVEQANRHRRPSPIHTGDYVWVASSKLSREEDISPKLLPRYLGPWQVLDTVGVDPFGPSYVIDVPLHLRTYPVFHASKLLPFTPADAFLDRPPQFGPPIPGKGYDVEWIEDEWGTGPDRQYLVRFAFQPPSENRRFYRRELLKTAKSVQQFNQLVVRSGHSCVAMNDHELLIFGGCKEIQQNHSSDVYKYNIVRKTWTRIATLGEAPLQCSEHSAVVIGKYMVVYGGWISEYYIPARAVHVLDLEQWTWSAVSLGKTNDPPPEVADHAAVAWKGGMYVCGGYREVEQPTESMLMYELRLEGVEGAQEPATPGPPRLQADMLRAMASYKYSDIALMASDGIEIPAHRVVLASRSEYFRALFEGEMQESQQKVIHLKTVSKDVLMIVLTFMYGGVVEVPSHLQLEVMSVADMLLLEDLKLECERHLKDAVGVENCCAFLQSADRHGASALRAHCLSFLVREYESVVGSSGYASLLSSSPALALEMSQALATRLKAISGPRTSRKRRNTMQGGDIPGPGGGGNFNFVHQGFGF
ncbi:hypothetical protein CBR_g12343 [Chara braunii]|uniref:Reverse transcriptase n=1 Tax=Chara braunii TaxID=69332 RepID=A0A388KRS9_CHABU|nr:hypothetical protein CBR_g12343 [Chara braunii]|eukprot:GBG72775.1 hypothetical protein CBR_g12343 [Chara braunii]